MDLVQEVAGAREQLLCCYGAAFGRCGVHIRRKSRDVCVCGCLESVRWPVTPWLDASDLEVIVCTDAEDGQLCRGNSVGELAVVFVVLWPVAMPLMYVLLLYRSRRPILSHQPNTLSRAIRFLWSEYEDMYFWYELVELTKKLALTNFVLFINFGSGSDKLLRLLVGLLVALLALTLQLQTQPFKKQSDDALSCVVQLMLVLFFILGIVIKLCDPDVGPTLAGGQASCPTLVGLDSAWTASVMLFSVGIGVVLIPVALFVRQLLSSRSMPILRDATTMEPPVLLLGEGERYHLFLSHIWSVCRFGP